MLKSLAAVAALAALAVPAAASAHDLTCSTSRFSHRADLKGYTGLVADDKPRVECIQMARNKIKLIGSTPGSRYTVKQYVVKYHEKTYGWPNSPFFYEVGYAIGKPQIGYYG